MDIIDAHVHVLSPDTARYPMLPGLIRIEVNADLADLVAARAAVRFAMDHIGCVHVMSGLTPERLRPVLALTSVKNLSVKYSTLNLNAAETPDGAAAMVGWLVANFGAERVIWSSNFPATLDSTYARLVEHGRESTVQLSEADRAAVLGGNARRRWWPD